METALKPAVPTVGVTVPGVVTGVNGVGAVGPVPVEVPELVPLLPEEELPLPEPDVPEPDVPELDVLVLDVLVV